MSPGSIVARAAAAAALMATALHLFWIYRDMCDARDSLECLSSLRRLAALTIRNFPARDLDSPELFWKAIGREGSPMRDVWGMEYRLSSREESGKRLFFWASAGPDRRFGSRDDLLVAVPYPTGPGKFPELMPGDALVPPPLSIDAK